MKAAVIDRYGGNEVLSVREVSSPQPGPGEVLIKARAAAVNPVDWKIRNGSLRPLTGWSFPKILGSECAGTVAEIGAGVRRFRIGDPVIGYPGVRRSAAFAEYVCVPEHGTFAHPENLSFEESSTLPIAGLTALQGLRDLGRLVPGNRVLINGASGGVGTFAVQLARLLEARVTGVCSGINAELVQSLGAERVIDYQREDFTTGRDRYELIFDAVSKRSFRECRAVLAPHGIYIATLPSRAILLNHFFLRILTRQQARLVLVRPNAQDMGWLRDQIEADRVRVVVDRVYPLEEIRAALAHSEGGRARGKIVLHIAPG